MSFDLGVWKSSPGLSATSASYIYGALCEGKHDARLLPAGAEIAAFYDDLVATWPEVSGPAASVRRTKGSRVDSPWVSPLHRGTDYLLMASDFEHAEIVVAFVTALAGRHGLTVFEPQSEEVYPPSV